MVIHNPILTGSFTVNNIDVSSITSSAANITALNATTASLNSFSASVLSYTASQNILNGTYTLTSSFNAQTASFTAFSASVLTFTGSASTRLGALEAATASLYTATSSFSGRVGALETYTSSLNNKTASFATTGSNNFTAVQHIADTTNPTGFDTTASLYTEGGFGIKKDTYISSSLYIKGNLTVYGTQSVSYITSSQLNISTNIITVNTSTPSVRFGGLAVIDSGSASGLTGSMLWDSQNNNWIYSNPSGSGNYDSSMVIMGPRNSSTLGNEQGLSCNYLVLGHGSHHTTSSGIFHDGTNTCIPNTLIGGTICTTMANASCMSIGTQTPVRQFTINGGAGNTHILLQNNSVGTAINNGFNIVFNTDCTAQMWNYQNASLQFATNNNARLTIASTGEACFACQVCASSFIGAALTVATSLTGVGRAVLNSGDATHSGYINWYNSSVSRLGYMGYNNTDIELTLEGTSTFKVTGGVACFACSVRVNSGGITLPNDGNNIDVGGVLIVRGNGSAYNTHYLTTGAANVAKYIQYNASGTAINQINAGGDSYITGGNVGIGTGTPSFLLDVSSTTGAIISSTTRTNSACCSEIRAAWSSGASMRMGYHPDSAVGYIDNTYPISSGQVYGDIQFRQSSAGTMTTRMTLKADGGQLMINTTCAAFGRRLTVSSDIVAYYSDAENITMGISAGTGAQSWGIQVCDTGDGSSAMHLNARGGPVGINIGNGNAASYPLHVNGTAYATGAAGALSDIRRKQCIQPLSKGLAEVMRLNPVEFAWKEEYINDCGMLGTQLGFVAQEVQEILPTNILTDRLNNNTLALKYNEYIPLLTKAIQEQQYTINTLKTCLGIS